MTQIAGQYVTSVGGLAGFNPFQNNLTPEWGTNAPTAPPIAQFNTVDCADWQLQKTAFIDDTTHTGSYGAQGVDITCEGFIARVNVILDQRYPPDMLAKFGYFQTKANPVLSTQNFAFNLGTRMMLVVGAGVSYPSDQFSQDFYYCPNVKCIGVDPVIDANSKKMVRMGITVTGNARIFKLPAEYVILQDYLVHLLSRGFTF